MVDSGAPQSNGEKRLLKVVQLEGFDRTREYGIIWDDLVANSKDNHIFLTQEWLDAWWKHFGRNRRMLLLAVEEKDRILAAAPLMNSTYTMLGLKLRNIEFIGTPHSDYHSFVLTEQDQACAGLLLNHLNSLAWDCVELKNVPEDTETAHALTAFTGQNLKLKMRVFDICPFLTLPRTPQEYSQNLSYKLRQNLRRNEKNLRKEHEVEFIEYHEVGTLEESMDVFFRLYQKRWESKGSSGKFADPVLRDFHLEVAKRFSEKGWLRLYFLTVDGEPVDAEYCFVYNRKLYSYMSGFDPVYGRYGVGNLSTYLSIEDCIKRGLNEFDFMRGDHSYKNRFATLNRRNIEMSSIRWKVIPKAYEWLVRSDLIPSLSKRLRERALSR
jgi:CelD/BcsL family acetyltransferase involved in cellulose biosynthesis